MRTAGGRKVISRKRARGRQVNVRAKY
ncbi:MAG: hypothetical protein B6D36_16490 [Planctomycetes bacterium UTPLA1]|nr:MAG: hypothetical protein B6D36_16490 [Planctomycetes bacterium UTPLA1]